MEEKLQINTQILQDKTIIEFIGKIDEDSNFSKVLSIESLEYIFDFDKIDFINSCGIREWISFVEKIKSSSKIIYKNCPQIILEQMNMVHGFIKVGASIESLYAPYFCETCDVESKVLLNTKDIKNKKAPKQSCGKCSEELEFDAIEEQYFSFL